MDGTLESGPFILSSLLTDVPLAFEDGNRRSHITCVEFWNDNLYIGTSTSEVLHYVLLPPDPGSEDDQTNFIPGFRLQPALPDTHENARGTSGVQQILVLPEDGKACVLCDGFLSFYNLPELSPAFEGTKPISCAYFGGVDQNLAEQDSGQPDGLAVMLCLKSKIRIVRIGDGPRKIRDIVLEGCVYAIRRDDIACIADGQSYSLLDVVHQQLIPLSPISSAFDSSASAPDSLDKFSSVSRPPGSDPGTLRFDDDRLQTSSSEQIQHDQESLSATSAVASASEHSAIAQAQPGSKAGASITNQVVLKPHIASPTSKEFLYTTGTSYDEPGLGMFVDFDGEPVRGTIEFAGYPEAVVIDGKGIEAGTVPQPGQPNEEGFVLAVVRRKVDQKSLRGIEIQRWDVDRSEGSSTTDWLEIHAANDSESHNKQPIGMRTVMSKNDITIAQLTARVGLKSLNLESLRGRIRNTDEALVKKRARVEADYAKRLSVVHASTIMWWHDRIWCVVRNPLVLRLDYQMPSKSDTAWQGLSRVKNLKVIERIVNSIRGRQPQSDLEFTGLTYIRQKAALLLLLDTLRRSIEGGALSDLEEKMAAEMLQEAEIDPRIILILIPDLREEVLTSKDGIWLYGGLQALVEDFLRNALGSTSLQNIGLTHARLVKDYLYTWQQKKGLASVTNAPEVFQTVDAALLHLLLLLDEEDHPHKTQQTRVDLHSFVQSGIDCIERGVELLESYRRLYVLSLLHQSNGHYGQVLATWRRILEGERDDGGELVNGERRMLNYLLRLKDAALVEEYGIWLAKRNPVLGVQVFANESSKTRFAHKHVVEILQRGAPDAVKAYLEHLVFGRQLGQYANDLIGYYLESVLAALDKDDDAATSALSQSYETYRALKPPKPTYSQFVSDNALDAEWWHSRLRLLQLLGGSHGAASQYDVNGIFERLAPYEEALVPEMIVLHGRQGRHQQALRLLTHGLGDFDTAVRYCILGGSSVYSGTITTGGTEEGRGSGSGSTAMEVPVALPEHAEQSTLFGYLLDEFFQIADESDRMAQIGELLGRFPRWFDVTAVLQQVPTEWSVEVLAPFLESAFRALVSERRETGVARALTQVENLVANAGLIEKMDGMGPRLVNGETLEHESGEA